LGGTSGTSPSPGGVPGNPGVIIVRYIT
jgi:hypothetical protein